MAFSLEAELSILDHLNIIKNRNKTVAIVGKDKIITFTIYCILLEDKRNSLNYVCIPSTWHSVGARFSPRLKQGSYIISLRPFGFSADITILHMFFPPPAMSFLLSLSPSTLPSPANFHISTHVSPTPVTFPDSSSDTSVLLS